MGGDILNKRTLLLGRIWACRGRRGEKLVHDLTAGFAVMKDLPETGELPVRPRPAPVAADSLCSHVQVGAARGLVDQGEQGRGAQRRERESRYPRSRAWESRHPLRRRVLATWHDRARCYTKGARRSSAQGAGKPVPPVRGRGKASTPCCDWPLQPCTDELGDTGRGLEEKPNNEMVPEVWDKTIKEREQARDSWWSGPSPSL